MRHSWRVARPLHREKWLPGVRTDHRPRDRRTGVPQSDSAVVVAAAGAVAAVPPMHGLGRIKHAGTGRGFAQGSVSSGF